MDPITTAIIAAIGAGALKGVGDTVSKSLVDSYNGLKSFLISRFGAHSGVADAIQGLENKPDSPGRQHVLAEEIEASKASEDQQVLQAAQSLLELIKQLPGGDPHIQSAHGVGIAQADRGSSASVNLGGS